MSVREKDVMVEAEGESQKEMGRATQLAWRMEEGAVNQGKQVASGKMARKHSLPQPLRGHGNDTLILAHQTHVGLLTVRTVKE